MKKIEFEGTDGAGKTTALTYFIEKARQRGLTVAETREVGNPNVPVCVKLRSLVLDPESGLSGAAMELIFSAMRIENDRWLNELKKKTVTPDLVVSDRGWFSHLAYTDHNVSKEFTELLYNGLMNQITQLPDVVIYFSVNTQTALQRRQTRGSGMDVIEMKGVGYQELVRESFLEHISYAQGTGIRFFTVDANQDIEGVRRQMDSILDSLSGDIANHNLANLP